MPRNKNNRKYNKNKQKSIEDQGDDMGGSGVGGDGGSYQSDRGQYRGVKKSNSGGMYSGGGGNYRNTSGGGGRMHYSSHHSSNYHHRDRNSRRNFFNPNVIKTLEEEQVDGHDEEILRAENGQNAGDYTGSKPNDNRRKNRNRKALVDRLKDMGVNKKKLAIGDNDDTAGSGPSRKPLLPSNPHCRLASTPEDVFALIVQYVQNYFTCFDANRNDLLGAYSEKCQFSISLNMSGACSHRSYKFDDALLKESRNLKRIVGDDQPHVEKRFRLLSQGHINTLAALLKLPPTEHEPSSFKLDNSFFSPHMISFTLSGVFREGKATDKVRPLRSFYRVFVCVPDTTSKMKIINEQFVLSNLTTSQFKQYYADKPSPPALATTTTNSSTTSTSTIQSTSPISAQATAAPSPVASLATSNANDPALVGLTQEQVAMVHQFSSQSRLNAEWSKHCLEFAKWSYDQAAGAYAQFKESIPQNAYIG